MNLIRPDFIEELNAGRPDGGFVGSVLPSAVTVVEGAVSSDADDLRPEEAAHVLNAVPKRRGEFATGRRFAHRALAMLQAPPGPLLVNDDRSPRWPPGVTGCITHTDRYCAVAVAPATEVAAIGIDVEDATRFDHAILRQVLSRREIETHLLDHDPERQRQRGATMFSAKESLYKCLATVASARLTFRDCAVELDRGPGVFRVELLTEAGPFGKGHRFTGRCAARNELVATAIVLPSRGHGS